MAVTNTLKYGTVVLAGMAAIAAFFYDSPTNQRIQIYMSDYVEIAEGLRERQMIVNSISGTNIFYIQIATNRSQMIAIDAEILNVVTGFVDHRKINDWVLASTNTTPPHWTMPELVKYVTGIETNRFPAYPIQTRKSDLNIRYAALTNLIFTDSVASWSTNRSYTTNESEIVDYYVETNFPGPFDYTNRWALTNQAKIEAWWVTNMDTRKPLLDWWTDASTNTYSTDVIDPSSVASPLIGLGLAPSWSWSGSVNVSSYYSEIYGGYNDSPASLFRVFRTKKYASILWLSNKRTSKITASAKVIPIERTDYFFFNKLLFESMPITSNVLAQTTSGWAEILDPVWGNTGFTATWNIATNIAVTELGAYIKMDKNAPGVTGTSSGRGGSTNSVLLNCIHRWDVERCRP